MFWWPAPAWPGRDPVEVRGAGQAAGGPAPRPADPTAPAADDRSGDEYVWLSANSRLPLFVAHDHPALHQAGRELGVRVTIAGPDTVDIPGLVAAVEQTGGAAADGHDGRRVGSLGTHPGDRPGSGARDRRRLRRRRRPGEQAAGVHRDRLARPGRAQAQAMVRALRAAAGTVAMLGLIEQSIDQDAFAGFRSVAGPAGLNVLEPFQDKGSQAEAARVAASLLQAHPDLVGMAGFDSESGPGMGQAIREAGKGGDLVATCVEAEEQHLRLVKEGMLHACVGQKRACSPTRA